jgi:hypothetical protein
VVIVLAGRRHEAASRWAAVQVHGIPDCPSQFFVGKPDSRFWRKVINTSKNAPVLDNALNRSDAFGIAGSERITINLTGVSDG